ncbi:hypothetical protein [Salinilacihabitans rarus]|uniref:hypothetical protein n=1 Tax=Salinilacihabitans rarus TaxID=2961596 RepID=UPI0020C8D718|nr:hypothetical protein [Salinilacihabitans rarus]
MKRTLIVVAIALAVLMAGCGGPGEAPENDTDGDNATDDPGAQDEENGTAALEPAAVEDEPLATAPPG